jgi:hypothetical protein
MAETVTLQQVEALIKQLSIEEQNFLVERMSERVARQRQERQAQAEALIKKLRENAVPGSDTDSTEAIRQMREERIAQLCRNDV